MQSNLATSNTGYNAISNGFSFPFDLICLNKRSDIMSPLYIEPISVSLECSIYPGSTVKAGCDRSLWCELFDTAIRFLVD